MLTLYPYQTAAVDFVIGFEAANPTGRLLLVIPPGGGKTPVGATIARRLVAERGLRGLTWGHRREIVGAIYDHLLACDVPRDMLGILMAGDPGHEDDNPRAPKRRVAPEAPIQVASIDTLRRRDKPPADFVWSDEAHFDAAEGRSKIRALYPDAFHLGTTATPVRLDGRGLRKEYDTLHVAAHPSELLAGGYIVAPAIWTVPEELLPRVHRIKRKRGDYDVAELEQEADRRVLIGGIVDHYFKHAGDRQTVAFPVGVKHSHSIVRAFRRANVDAWHLDGDTSPKQRRYIFDGIRDGGIRLVSSCGVLSTGTNLPMLKAAILARPTLSLALFIQQATRIDRVWGDVEPVILDHAGNCMKHGHPLHDHPWSIDDGPGRQGVSAATLKTCKECFRLVPSGCATCPACGAAFDVQPREPAEEAGDLTEYRPTFTEEEKRAGLEHIRRFAAVRGFSDEWVGKVYAAKFGEALVA